MLEVLVKCTCNNCTVHVGMYISDSTYGCLCTFKPEEVHLPENYVCMSIKKISKEVLISKI